MNDSSEQVANQSDPSQVPHPLKSRQVLLVEDEPDHQRLYHIFLQLAGAEVTLACNGQSAVDTVTKSPTRFDAVVMDFIMPSMDGIEATQILRELGYDGAIIAMTACYLDELKQSWFQAGCDELLDKMMINQTKLISTIQLHTTGCIC